MRFAEDRRARVPFALVGVVLLVGSAGLSATLAGGPTAETDESVGLAMDRTTAAATTALREAVASAGREAAREPVTDAANATAGRVLNDSTPYRDYLRIRLYLAARDELDSVAVRVGGVEGSVALPAAPNATALRAAKRRVELEPAGEAENAGLRVRIENVTVTAARERAVTGDTRVVSREDLSPTLTVSTPALALHERVERFESRLNRGPLAPGLGRRLTGRLYAVAWARGYAQYGRAPVENVVANRHVELATNGALLREQRVAFGESDPAGRRAVGWATARVGATDLLAAADVRYGSEWSSQLLAAADRYQQDNPMPGGVTSGESGTETPSPNRTARVGVNRTADRAFADLVRGENGTGLADVLRSGYAVDARLVAAVRKTDSEPRPSPSRPGANWSLRGTDVRTTTRVDAIPGPPPGPPSGWHRLESDARRVVRTHSATSEWVRRNETGVVETRRTVRQWTDTHEVRLGVVGDHDAEAAVAAAPSRPVAGVHESGGALDGPNLRGVDRDATETLVDQRGGFDALARRAVAGTLDTRPRTVAAERPDDLRRWVYADLASLRERVRNVSVTRAASETLGGATAAETLAQKLRERRASLVDAPARYDGVADRARVAARSAYLDRVLGRLDARAERVAATRSGLDEVLGEVGASLDGARRVLRNRSASTEPSPRPLSADGPGRAMDLDVSGAPPYLTLAELDHEQVEAIPAGEQRYPLAARNVNVFTAPYDEAADAVASAVVGDGGGSSEPTDLRTAALALRAANRTLAERENATLERGQTALRGALSDAMERARGRLVADLSGSRFDLTRAERRDAVRSGLSDWSTTHSRALAVANGSARRAIIEAVVDDRPALDRADRRDWLDLRVELALESTRREVAGPPRSVVNRTATATRSLAREALATAVSDSLANATEVASDRWFGEALGAVPAGLPVAPVPGYWYATANVWTVDVRGEYARFAVRAPHGPPDESTTYVRAEDVVRLDWDGDGDAEVVGETAPVGFETETVVAVVVPPGPPGVGDRDGVREEESAGWSSE